METLILYPLTSEAVETTFQDCLAEEADQTTAIVVEGVLTKATFSSERIEQKRPAIEAFLQQLPWQFRKSMGGGWSFLNMNQDNDDNQWADLHRTMDYLVCLGKATGRLTTSPSAWNPIMPGNMPFVFIDL
jgi:hypothetical protein